MCFYHFVAASVKDTTNAGKGEIHKCIRQKLSNSRSHFMKKLGLLVALPVPSKEGQQCVAEAQQESADEDDDDLQLEIDQH